jgi:mannose-6-phosphate isomerase-like protein (cupin superfamily)
MRACRTASIVLFGALFVSGAVGACREPEPPSVPPLTTAQPTASVVAAPASAAPAVETSDAGSASTVAPATPGTPTIEIVDASKTLTPPPCSRLFVAAAKGMVAVDADTLRAGDVVVVSRPDHPAQLKVNGLAVVVVKPLDCSGGKLPPTKTLVRAKDTPELRWAGGKMSAHLDVGTKVSPEIYLGRLEGTAPVAEHDHPTSDELLAVIEGSGTQTLAGEARRIGPRQVVVIPKKTKHSYVPDPGSKLVAIQMYDPPGPEQRFIGLAAAEAQKDQSKDAGAR